MLKPSLTLATLTALLLLAPIRPSEASSIEFLDFTVDESSVSGAADPFTADRILGLGQHLLSVDITGTYLSASAFSWTGYALDSFLVLSPTTELADPAEGYAMYAILATEGTVEGGTSLIPATGEIQFFLDPGFDTTLSLTSPGVLPTRGGTTSDDIPLLSSSALLPSAYGVLSSLDLVLFDLRWLVVSAPSSYWPEFPFPSVLHIGGEASFQSSAAFAGNEILAGSAEAFFTQPVPEPATLGLLALGLAAVALRRRLMRL